MNNNIIKRENESIIFCGGNPLNGCPQDWEDAKIIIEKMNDGKTSSEPQWSFDCGFKLDYVGELLSIGSRFYPPKTHYGATWDGTVRVYLRGETIQEKNFDCQTLEELKKQVDDYINEIIEKLQSIFNDYKHL